MKEVEVKILEIDVNSVISKIESLGGVKEFDGPMHAVYYRKNGINHTVRIRKEGDSSVFCVKVKNDSEGIMNRDEFEVTVSDFDIMNSILIKLGFIKKWDMHKTRVEYKIKNCHLAIDNPVQDFVPPFLEVESDNSEDMYEMVSLLGFSKEECKGWTGSKVLKYYREKN